VHRRTLSKDAMANVAGRRPRSGVLGSSSGAALMTTAGAAARHGIMAAPTNCPRERVGP
jgi:hypothetical protein